MGDPTNEPPRAQPDEPSAPPPGNRAAITPLRILLWVLVGGFALFLIVTGIVGILTKAR